MENTDIFTYTGDKLDDYLVTCILKKEKNIKLRTSLETLCHGLKRALKNFGYLHDITAKKCMSFSKSIKEFKAAMQDLNKSGKGHVTHHTEIYPKGH